MNYWQLHVRSAWVRVAYEKWYLIVEWGKPGRAGGFWARRWKLGQMRYF